MTNNDNKVNGVNAGAAGMNTDSRAAGADMTVSNGAGNGRLTASWPMNCPWPEPTTDSSYWEAEDVERLSPSEMDEWLNGLVDVKEYFDDLVQCGRLNEDYSLNPYYDDTDEKDADNADTEDTDYDDMATDNDASSFTPEKGEEYWDVNGITARFDLDAWSSDVAEHLNLLKLPLPSPVSEIENIIGYSFINQNLLRQAFTRRSFAVEHDLGDSERLEFIGDAVLHTVLTREMARQMTDVDVYSPHEPFHSMYSEGELTTIRTHFESGEYLAERAAELGLDKYVLQSQLAAQSAAQPATQPAMKSESTAESAESAGTAGNAANSVSAVASGLVGGVVESRALEDTMEALIGAVAVDCNWDWYTLEAVIDRLLCVQLESELHNTDRIHQLLRPSYYDIFNSWHQKHFGRMPDYEVSKGMPATSYAGLKSGTMGGTAENAAADMEGLMRLVYHCTLRFSVPENGKGIRTEQIVAVVGNTRTQAREKAADKACSFVVNNGLWMNLSDAGIEPKLDDAINQLQELYQKKYVAAPEYWFDDRADSSHNSSSGSSQDSSHGRRGSGGGMPDDAWYCCCSCNGLSGWGKASNKVKAKKKAAFMVLVRLLDSAGLANDEMRKAMWKTMESERSNGSHNSPDVNPDDWDSNACERQRG